MTLKTLLLGSAATLAVVGGAQAADLSVAEPVEYVKVCDYFGTGYWYIPGTDTCIKVGGFVEFDANFGGDNYYGTSYSTWNFTTDAEVTVSTKSETEYGVLETYVALKDQSDPSTNDGGGYLPHSSPGDSGWFNDNFWVALGGFKAGHYWSPYNTDFSYVDDFGLNIEMKPGLHNNLAQLSWAAGGFGATIALEEPANLFDYYTLPDTYGDTKLPIIDGILSFTGSTFTARIAGAYTQVDQDFYPYDSGVGSWGVDANVVFNIGKSDHLLLSGAYGDNAFTNSYDSAFGEYYHYAGANNGYSLMGSFQHIFSPTFRFDVDASYAKGAHFFGSDAATRWEVSGDLVWAPVTGLKVKAGVGYVSTEANDYANFGFNDASTGNAWVAQLAVRRDW